jgi:hypothetical protein
MPQTDLLGFPSTIFFLIITFVGGYFFWVSVFFPRIMAILKVRKSVSLIRQSDVSKNLSTFSETNLRKSLRVNSTLQKGLLRSTFFIPFFLASVDDLLLAFNFFNLIICFYFVLRASLVSSQSETSLAYLLPITSLDYVTELSNKAQVVRSYIFSSLKNDFRELILDLNLSWSAKRNLLFFSVSSSIINITIKQILDEHSQVIKIKLYTALAERFKLAKRILLTKTSPKARITKNIKKI